MKQPEEEGSAVDAIITYFSGIERMLQAVSQPHLQHVLGLLEQAYFDRRGINCIPIC